MPTINRASFVHPISPPGDVNPTVHYVSAEDADLTLDGSYLRIAWKNHRALYRLVPVANVRELVVIAEPAKPSTPAQQPPQAQPKAKAR